MQTSPGGSITCRHCGDDILGTTLEIESFVQPQPSPPSYWLEVWTCPRCGWKNVLSKTEHESS